jgi:uncharacterized membrane protein YedE/YeeE
MENLFEAISQPWPWYVAGPLIGLMVPVLLILGNKNFGISSSLRHICAICIPSKIPFFHYNWRSEAWNLIFVLGIIGGAFFSAHYLDAGNMIVNENLKAELTRVGINDYSHQMPHDLFNFANLFTAKGIMLTVIGGFLVGFGTRYAGGCTSGHSITGISMLQMASVIATICFMIGGFFVANLVLPVILSW